MIMRMTLRPTYQVDSRITLYNVRIQTSYKETSLLAGVGTRYISLKLL
jgi:hypothetical protein